MRITKFNRIKARTYHDFSWPSDLPEFADYNLIYGWNGTGKTTLADILRMVEKRESVGQEGISDFSIAYGPHALTPANIATIAAPPSIRVFNRAFVNSNVFSESGATPIFFIGEENIGKQKELEKQKKALAALETDADAKQKEKGKKEKELDNFCTDKAKTTREWLGINNTQTYNKSHFRGDCESLISEGNAAQNTKTAEEISSLKVTIALPAKEAISPVSLKLPDLTALAAEVKTLLQKTVVSQTIEALAKDSATSDWVIINHKKPAEDINKDLKDYLGHSEIQFATKDGETGYTIMRGDKLAQALSEGEKTAIALLHFLKTLEDQKFKLSDGIVVIDDPVCSMDDTSMFRAFSYIKDRTKTARQLFILTHNFVFFRQVKNWFHHIKKPKTTGFYQTVSAIENDARSSRIRKLDRLLHEYNSEYHHLFDLTYKASENTNMAATLEPYYHMPNVARRLLENFLAFKMPNISGELHKKVEESTFDAPKKTSILRFLHTHSHEDHIGSGEHDASILAETPQIMKIVLEMIEHEDKSHYDRMISLVAPLPAANANQTAAAKSA